MEGSSLRRPPDRRTVVRHLSDRFGARFFATAGLLLVALTFVLLLFIPVNFDYRQFATITFLSGIESDMFGAPHETAIMNSVPAKQRGSASGMAGTVQNAGTSPSMGVFFSLMIASLSVALPTAGRFSLNGQRPAPTQCRAPDRNVPNASPPCCPAEPTRNSR